VLLSIKITTYIFLLQQEAPYDELDDELKESVVLVSRKDQAKLKRNKAIIIHMNQKKSVVHNN
jgi:hypothetical protein